MPRRAAPLGLALALLACGVPRDAPRLGPIAAAQAAPVAQPPVTPASSTSAPAPRAEPAVVEPPLVLEGALPPITPGDLLARWRRVAPTLIVPGDAGAPPRARFWLAVVPAGLTVAGEVGLDDDAAQAGAKVELALALPAPELPPLGFVTQWGLTEVPDARWCRSHEDVYGPATPDDLDACEAWVATQSSRREAIAARFHTAYVFDAIASPTSRRESFAGGYRFEATIPARALPSSAQAPLRDLSLAFAVIEPGARGAAIVRAPLGALRDRPETYRAARLASPLRLGRAPALLERVLAATADAHSPAFVEPTPESSIVHVLVNPAMAYQGLPVYDSPAVVDVDVGHATFVATLGELSVVRVPAGVGVGTALVHALAVLREDGSVVDMSAPSNRELVATARRAPGLHLVTRYDGSFRPLGNGQCGACPWVEHIVETIAPTGRFGEPIALEGVGGNDASEAHGFLAPDGGFGVRWTEEPIDIASGRALAPVHRERLYRWDARRRVYGARERTLRGPATK